MAVLWQQTPAGDVNALTLGPSGASPTRLVRRLTPILSIMTLVEAIETTRILSDAGLTGDRTALVTTRSCRALHRTISDVGLLGGGHLRIPGEVALAPNGILFLDELPEFRRHVLEGAATARRRNRDDHWRVDVYFISHPSDPTRPPLQ